MDNETALDLLRQLLPTGALRIITSEVVDDLKDLAQLHVGRIGGDPQAREQSLQEWRQFYADPTHRKMLLDYAKLEATREERFAILGVPALPGTNLRDPRSFVTLKAIRMDPLPNAPGHYVVSSDEHFFATISGEPEALLRDLQKWQQPAPAAVVAGAERIV